MAIAPEEIADQAFQVGLRGYDRDQVRKFLNLVADDYRTLWEKSEGPQNALSAPDATAGPSTVATGQASPDVWAQMGDEVAKILQGASKQAAAVKRKAHREAADVKAEAEQTKAAAETYVAELLTKADTAAEAHKARTEAELKEAKEALAHAQHEALTLVADTETKAKRMLQATERKARALPAEMLAEARGELTRLTQSQEHLYQWLETTRNHLAEAIGTYQSTAKPDLTELPDLIDLTDDNHREAANGDKTEQRPSPA